MTINPTWELRYYLPQQFIKLKKNKKEKIKKKRKTKGMFGNCFFPLFFVFKNNFLFLRLKNLFGN